MTISRFSLFVTSFVLNIVSFCICVFSSNTNDDIFHIHHKAAVSIGMINQCIKTIFFWYNYNCYVDNNHKNKKLVKEYKDCMLFLFTIIIIPDILYILYNIIIYKLFFSYSISILRLFNLIQTIGLIYSIKKLISFDELDYQIKKTFVLSEIDMLMLDEVIIY